jgi:hypothetical protein
MGPISEIEVWNHFNDMLIFDSKLIFDCMLHLSYHILSYNFVVSRMSYPHDRVLMSSDDNFWI